MVQTLFLTVSFLITNLEEANAAEKQKDEEIVCSDETTTYGSRRSKGNIFMRIPSWVPKVQQQCDCLSLTPPFHH